MYVIKVVPAVIPETMPDNEPIEPTAALLLLQRPPLLASLSGVVAPVHTLAVPSIGAGIVLTVTTTVATNVPQPLDSV